jgi:hypothetical protein
MRYAWREREAKSIIGFHVQAEAKQPLERGGRFGTVIVRRRGSAASDQFARREFLHVRVERAHAGTARGFGASTSMVTHTTKRKSAMSPFLRFRR